jgi:hypothetical protein
MRAYRIAEIGRAEVLAIERDYYSGCAAHDLPQKSHARSPKQENTFVQ